MRRIILSRRFWLGLILVVGLALRVGLYLENRSLWLDEAYVANQVLSQSWGEILGNVAYDPNLPGPPVGFLLVEKLLVLIFGNTEYALRLVPQLAALAALVLFFLFLRRSVDGPGLLVGLALFAVCGSLVYYSAQMKPYGIEVFWGVLIPWVVIRARKAVWSQRWLLWGMGAGALLFSYASVFLLAGAGLVLLGDGLRHPSERRQIGLVLGGWLVAFLLICGMYWQPMLQRLRMNPAIWQGPDVFFIPWPFWTGSAGRQAGQLILAVLRDPAGMCCPWLAGGIFLLGVVRIWGRDRGLALLLILPMLLLLAASAARQYFFYGRFVLFLLPAIFFMIAAGIDALWQWPAGGRGRILAPVCGALLVIPALLITRGQTGGGDREDMRGLVQQMLPRYRATDTIYVNDFGQFAFMYYFARAWAAAPERPRIVVFGDSIRPGQDGRPELGNFDLIPRDLARISYVSGAVRWTPLPCDPLFAGRGRVWMLVAHNRAVESVVLPLLARQGRCVFSAQRAGGAVYLYESRSVPAL